MIKLLCFLIAFASFSQARSFDFESLRAAIYPPTTSVTAIPAVTKKVSNLRVAFVTEYLEKNPNLVSLANQMVKTGHEVEIFVFDESPASVKNTFQVTTVTTTDLLEGGEAFSNSVRVYHLLAASQAFDIVHFDFEDGLGFVSMEAKRAGTAFKYTTLVVGLFDVEIEDISDESTYPELVTLFMERKSVEYACRVWTEDQETVDMLSARGFKFDEVTLLPQKLQKEAVGFLSFYESENRNVVQSEPLVSIVVTVFNRDEELLECVASLEGQTYSNVEIIFVNDGSSNPKTLRILKDLKNYHTVVDQANQYLGAARNAGVKVASGDYVLFMDDDNIARSDMVSSLIHAVQASGASVAVNGHYLWETGTPKSQAREWYPVGPDALSGILGNSFGNANFLISRPVFEKMAGFTIDRTGFEDYEFHAKATLAGVDYVVVPECLMYYRQHNDASEQMVKTMDMKVAYARVLRAYKNILAEAGISTLAARDYMHSKREISSSCTFTAVHDDCGVAGNYEATINSNVDASPAYAGLTCVPLVTSGTVSNLLQNGQQAFSFDITGATPGPITVSLVCGGITTDCDGPAELFAPTAPGDCCCVTGSNSPTSSTCIVMPACQCPTVCSCVVSGPGTIGITGLADLLAHWGPCSGAVCMSDCTMDSVVGISDLATFLLAWSNEVNGFTPSSTSSSSSSTSSTGSTSSTSTGSTGTSTTGTVGSTSSSSSSGGMCCCRGFGEDASVPCVMRPVNSCVTKGQGTCVTA